MTAKQVLTKRSTSLMMALCFSVLAGSPSVSASEHINPESIFTTLKVEPGGKFKSKAFDLTNRFYSGRSDTAGKASMAAVEKRNEFTWGINGRGLSILKRF